MSLIDDIRAEREARYKEISERGFTIPTWDRLVAVFVPLRDRDEIMRTVDHDDLIDVAVARLAAMCIRVDQLDNDGKRVPLVDDNGAPVRLDATLGRMLGAPDGVLGNAKNIVTWLVDSRPDALVDWSLQVYRWASAESQGVDNSLVGESPGGQQSMPSPAPATLKVAG